MLRCGPAVRRNDAGPVEPVVTHTLRTGARHKTATTIVNFDGDERPGMGTDDAESCGRCAMSSTTDLFEDPSDPYADDRIEVDEREARAVSPAAWLGGVKRRLDDWATRITYGR
jgi:hypothetical protein